MAEPPPDLAVRVAETVSDARRTPTDELPPLADAVDPDALEALVPSSTTGPFPDVTVTFTYAGQRVFVCSGNTVYVHPRPENREDSVEAAGGDGR